MRMLGLAALLFTLFAAASCKRGGTVASTGTATGPQRVFTPPGKCFGKKGAVSCKTDTNCGAFSLCQEGICCSGTLDDKDCSCHCAGGGECAGGQLCCPGACFFAPDLGVERCRPAKECFKCGPS